MTQWYAISRHIVSRSSAACWICWPHDIHLLAWSHLSAEQQAGLRERYLRGIFPLVTPLALDPAHPFPFVSNLSLNLLVTGHGERGATVLVRVKVPVGDDIPRLLRVGDKPHFVRLEDVMAHTLDVLFPGLEVISCELFRITRNANTERDEGCRRPAGVDRGGSTRSAICANRPPRGPNWYGPRTSSHAHQ